MSDSMYTDEQWRFVFDLYKTGYTINALAGWLGVSRETVRRTFGRLGFRAPVLYELPPLETYNQQFNSLRGEEQ